MRKPPFSLVLVLLITGCSRGATASSTLPNRDDAKVTPRGPVSVARSESSFKPEGAAKATIERLRELESTGPVVVSDLRFTDSVTIPETITLHPVGDAALVVVSSVVLLLEGNDLRRDEALSELRYTQLDAASRMSFAGTWPQHVWMTNSYWSDAGPSCGTIYRWQSGATPGNLGSWEPVGQEVPGISSLAASGDSVLAVGDGYGAVPETQEVWRIDRMGITPFKSDACTDGDTTGQPLVAEMFEDTLRVAGHRCGNVYQGTGDPAVVTQSWNRSAPNQSKTHVLVEDDAWIDARLFRDAGHLYGVGPKREGRRQLARLDGSRPELIGELPADAVLVDAPGTNDLWLIFDGHLVHRERETWKAIPLSEEMKRHAQGNYPRHEVWVRGPHDIWLNLDGSGRSLNHTGPISLGPGVSELDTDEVIRLWDERLQRAEARANAPCPEGFLVELYKLDPFTFEATINPATDLMTRAQILGKVRAAVRRFASATPVQHDCCGEACVGVTVSNRNTAEQIIEMLRRPPESTNDMRWNESMRLSCGVPPWVAPLRL